MVKTLKTIPRVKQWFDGFLAGMDGSAPKSLLHGIMGIFKTAGTGEHFYVLENHCEASARRNDVIESLYALLWKRGGPLR
jgi:hypothetical protein